MKDKKLPDNLQVAEITIKETDVKIYLSHFVKMNVVFPGQADFWHIEVRPDDSAQYMYSTRVKGDDENKDLSFDKLIKSRTSWLKPHLTRIMPFVELPEAIKSEFRKFEEKHEFDLDAIEWHVSFGHGSIYFQ